MSHHMILNRIKGTISAHLTKNQNGFREGRPTIQNLELKDNLTVVVCFVDFKKPFDSIHRGMIMEIIKAYGVPPTYFGPQGPYTQ